MIRKPIQITLAVLLLLMAASAPTQAQGDPSWRDQWYWGGQVGALLYTAGGSEEIAYPVGGHWFITAGRSALYFAFDEVLYDNALVTLSDGRQVGFDKSQRIQASVFAIPNDNKLQIYLGGGFAIQHITDAAALGTFASAAEQRRVEDQIDQLATKAFVLLSGGFQLRFISRWALFGQYQFTPSTDDFLITSDQHSISAGLRYALTHAQEEVTTRR